MIVMISVQYPIPIDKDVLSTWGYEREPKKRGTTLRSMLVVQAQNGCRVTYRYIPYTIKRYPLLPGAISNGNDENTVRLLLMGLAVRRIPMTSLKLKKFLPKVSSGLSNLLYLRRQP